MHEQCEKCKTRQAKLDMTVFDDGNIYATYVSCPKDAERNNKMAEAIFAAQEVKEGEEGEGEAYTPYGYY